ncbi:MAG: hypothetical protein WD883_01155 [Candidatus Colwellbacteria bacterium]
MEWVIRGMILVTLILFVGLTVLDVLGVEGTILVVIASAIWGVGMIIGLWLWLPQVLSATVMAVASARAARALRWAFALSTMLVLWALLLGVIPFEDNPATLVWMVGIAIALLGVLAIPRQGRVRSILVWILIIALVLVAIAAFGFTPKQGAGQVAVWLEQPEDGILCVGYARYTTPDWDALGGVYEEPLRTDCWNGFVVTPGEGGATTWFTPLGGCIEYRFEDGVRGTDCPGEENLLEPRRMVAQFRAIDPGAKVQVTYHSP